MRESVLESDARKFAIARGWFEIKIMRASKNGFPDRFYARDGVIMLIEYKAPGKDVIKGSQQDLRINELRQQGVTVHVINTIEDAKSVLY